MRWEELSELLLDRGQENPEFSEEQVFVWDVSTGEFYPADTLDTQESDGTIDANRLFISIREDEI